MHRAHFPEIGEAADGPQPSRLGAALGRDRGILGDQLQDGEVDCLRCGAKERIVTLRLETADERLDVREIEIGIAPVDEIEGAEAVLLDRIDLFVG